MKTKGRGGKGTYIILFHRKKGDFIRVGKLGELFFRRGYYAYVGSAFGPGGVKSRLKHHIGAKRTCHWHIDYLDPVVKEAWVSLGGLNLEHEWADALHRISQGSIPGFGCSDCRCRSHLFYFRAMGFLEEFTDRAAINRATRLRDYFPGELIKPPRVLLLCQ